MDKSNLEEAKKFNQQSANNASKGVSDNVSNKKNEFNMEAGSESYLEKIKAAKARYGEYLSSGSNSSPDQKL